MLNRVDISHPEINTIAVFENQQSAAHMAAEMIVQAVKENPSLAITFATGDTMIPVYQSMTTIAEEQGVSFKDVRALHLDEYHPCLPTAPHSFVGYLYKYVFNPLGLDSHNIYTLNGEAQNADEEAARYEDLVNQMRVNLALLGIGPGGHIGFNEQGTPHNSRTHLAQLSPETIQRDKDRGQDSSETALTQGIGNILEAEQILLVAYGQIKGTYLRPALYDPISEDSPASALRTVGDKVTIVIDEEAASQLR